MAEGMTKKIKILHIIKDDKFFDSLIKIFESDSRLDNKSILPVRKKENYIFRRIRNTDIVELVNISSLKNVFKNKEYDIIFFHSLPIQLYKYVPLIKEDIIVIWWAWGYDLYSSFYGMKPLIELDLYKPLTKKIVSKVYNDFMNITKSFLKKLFLSNYYKKIRNKVLYRIDYFNPVIQLEYELMNNYKNFRAKEFYYSIPITHTDECINVIKRTGGNILIGHSQSPFNNHIDVWNDIKEFVPSNRKIVIPINYLGDKQYAKEICYEIKSDVHEIFFLKEFLNVSDYFNLLDECSYAIFGVIRQQAIGNINYCLTHGIKLFVYKDSLVYRYLKKIGCAVYTIEEIDYNSFNSPLSKEEIIQNKTAIYNQQLYNNNIYESVIQQILTTK